MEKGAEIINYKGKEIYYVDYSDIKTNGEFLAIIKQTNAFREKLKAEGRRNMLMLVNITGSYVYGDVLEEIKKAGRETKHMIRKQAVVGITGGKKILLNIVQSFTGMNLKVFDTIEGAKEWLIADDGH
jgi:hypothetical protein